MKHRRLLVLGGTGRTGRRIVSVAVEQGFTPVVFGRSADPDRVPPGAEAFPGDVLDEAAVAEAVSGVDAVVTALSIPRRSRSPFSAVTGPEDLHSRSTAMLIELLRRSRNAPKRLVKLSAQGVGDSASRAGWAFRALVQLSNLRPAFEDHARADDLLRAVPTGEDGVAWTIARPPILSESDEPLDLVASEDATTTSFTRVPIGSVARWIVNALDDDGTIGRVLTLRPPA